MDGPEILARTMTATRIPDQLGNLWQYHPRSDRHSKVACWAAFFDLLGTSALLRRHVAEGNVIFGINHTMRDFKTRRKKDLDLVIARPGTEEPNPRLVWQDSESPRLSLRDSPNGCAGRPPRPTTDR